MRRSGVDTGATGSSRQLRVRVCVYMYFSKCGAGAAGRSRKA